MKMYFVKIALRGVSPMVWRRLRIPENTSLAQLHNIIQIAYNWDDEYLHQFHTTLSLGYKTNSSQPNQQGSL